MSFKIQVRPSGHEFTANPEESILEAALHHSHPFPYGCRNGACGACKGRVLSGEVDYGDNEPMALSEEEMAAGDALFCICHPRSDLVIQVNEISSGDDIEVQTFPCKVARLEQLAHDVMLMELSLPEEERLPFLAGQYIDIVMEDGRHRAFSLANAPHNDNRLELHLRRVPGGEFTDHVFTAMQPKEILRIEGPHGGFFLREESERPILMVAGGTGFAPLKGMIEHAFYVGIERPIHIFWGVRALRDLYMDGLAKEWLAAHPNVKYTPVLSEPMAEDNWQGETGYVHQAVVKAYPELSGFDVYMAGPPPMVQASKSAFEAAGLPLEQMYSDAFEYAKK